MAAAVVLTAPAAVVGRLTADNGSVAAPVDVSAGRASTIRSWPEPTGERYGGTANRTPDTVRRAAGGRLGGSAAGHPRCRPAAGGRWKSWSSPKLIAPEPVQPHDRGGCGRARSGPDVIRVAGCRPGRDALAAELRCAPCCLVLAAVERRSNDSAAASPTVTEIARLPCRRPPRESSARYVLCVRQPGEYLWLLLEISCVWWAGWQYCVVSARRTRSVANLS